MPSPPRLRRISPSCVLLFVESLERHGHDLSPASNVFHVTPLLRRVTPALPARDEEHPSRRGLRYVRRVVGGPTREHAKAPEPLGFGPSLEIRAYLLQREQGNLLIYKSVTLEQDIEEMGDLGGISRQYLNHHHEASPACDWVAKTFDAPSVSETCNVAETFSERHYVGEDFEVIPTPGHTSGAAAFLWGTGQHRTLFTGDTIFFIGGELRAALLDGISDREKYIESLELIHSLDFDLVVPGIAAAGEPYYAFVEKAEAERRIDEILERVRRGESG